MATVPGVPQIRIRPRATDQTLEFFWRPPVSNGGDPITTYVVTDGGSFSNNVTAPATYFKQTGLTNKTEYTFTIQASNSIGLGDPATFRAVQPGLLPPNPNYLSIYRQSETSAELTWNNPATDGNTPDPWRNILLKPVANANGQIVYPGDNSITSNAVRMFGNETRAQVSVALDVSANFIVRAMNDPGYSAAYNGTGVFSLKDTPYTDDVIYTELADSLEKNATNFIVQKMYTGPVQNLGTPITDISNAYFTYAHQRGILFTQAVPATSYSVTAVNKNGFAKFTTPPLNVDGVPAFNSRTNPVIPILPNSEFAGASSNFPVYVFDSSDDTYASTIVTKSGGGLIFDSYNNNRDTNAYFALYDNINGGFNHYTIPTASKTPVNRYTSGSFSNYSNEIQNGELFVTMKEPTDTTWDRILYVPNTGSHVLYNTSALSIGAFTDPAVHSVGKLMFFVTPILYNFTLTGSPSYTARTLSGSGLSNISTSNSFSNFYNGFTRRASSYVDISGDSIRYAISPLLAEPAKAYSGTSQTVSYPIATSAFTGELYYNNSSEYHFTGVAQVDGSGGTVQMKYGPGGTAILQSGYAVTKRDYPEYSLLFFTTANYPTATNPLVRLKYKPNTHEFDVSGADISGGGIVATSDNSGVNFFSVSGNAYASYKVGPNLFPPVELTQYFSNWYSTFPSGSYTIGRVDSTDIYHLYENDVFDSSGNLGFTPTTVVRGPDCWYFIWLAGGGAVYVTRITTAGAKQTAGFPIANDTLVYASKAMPNGFLFVVYSTPNYVLISFNTLTNTFSTRVLDGALNDLYTTYVPNQ